MIAEDDNTLLVIHSAAKGLSPLEGIRGKLARKLIPIADAESTRPNHAQFCRDLSEAITVTPYREVCRLVTVASERHAVIDGHLTARMRGHV